MTSFLNPSLIPHPAHPQSQITDSPNPSTADLVQDIYLRELRNYKIPQPKPNEAEGHVQKFAPPSPPKSPEEVNLAGSVSEYEAQTVEIEGQAAAGEQAEPEEDYFEDIEEKEEEAHGQGH